MNHMKNMRWGVLAAICATALVSCAEDDIIPNGIDEGRIDPVGECLCTVYNPQGAAGATLQLYTEPVSGEVQVVLSSAAGRAVDLKFTYDPTVLEAYNEAHATSFEAVPAQAVELEADGALLVGPKSTRSELLRVSVRPDEAMSEVKSYALPLRLSSPTEGVNVSSTEGSYIFWVQVRGEHPSTQKSTGFITVCYVEVNENNPLNALEWSCKASGKPLFDIVNIFAANINWLEEEKRVGVVLNPNVRHILDNRDIYIKPLQDAGMRVSLTILGNGDGSGVANLSDAAAHQFAQELKSIVETYGLDGVDFDDEYSQYEAHLSQLWPGCVTYGPGPYARLLYEVKMAMPDKLVQLYQIGQANYGFKSAVEGVRPGDFIDYAYCDYDVLMSPPHLGLSRSQWGEASLDMTYGSESNPANLRTNRSSGNGVQMVYNLKPGNSQFTPLNDVAKYIYDDEAVWSGVRHEKDWK